jgi:DNA ligase-1
MTDTKLSKLVEVFACLERTSSSLAMIDILADFFPKISPQEAEIAAYLLQGELSPSYEGLEIGLADKMVMRAISRLENISVERVESLFKKTGDLGLVVEDLRKNKNGTGLTIKEAFENLIEITKTTGEGSQEKKIDLLVNLLSKTSGQEAKYIIRTILGTLRLGVGEMIFLYGLAKAFGSSKKDKEILEYAFNVLSDLGEVSYAVSKTYADLRGLNTDLRRKKIKEVIGKIEPKVGVPIRMMLANRIEGLEEIKKHISGSISVEDKYDGERIQAHIKKNKEIILFSRRQENITHQYPDIVEGLKKAFHGKEAIIEGEVVPFDAEKNKILPFQVLMSRRRKHGIEEYMKKIPVRYFLFDLLYLDGKNYLKKSLKERRVALEQSFRQIKPISFGRCIVSDDLSEIEAYFADSIKRGNEGVMIKDYSGIYRAGARGWLWIKFKKEYKEELADTFDLAVVGGLYGAGRRARTYGSLLVAACDPKTNKYYSFTKVGAGFTDENLAQLPKMLDKYKLEKKHKLVETDMDVDVWFEPKIVMEVSGAEITISPVHAVARDKITIERGLTRTKTRTNADIRGGLALRFPKFLRWRKDKSAEEATTVKEIYDLYKATKRK